MTLLANRFRIFIDFLKPLAVAFKGIVQRDVRGVESRLKRSALMNYLVALVYFFKLRGHSCERSKKSVSGS
jgi:hypothetical protein